MSDVALSTREYWAKYRKSVMRLVAPARRHTRQCLQFFDCVSRALLAATAAVVRLLRMDGNIFGRKVFVTRTQFAPKPNLSGRSAKASRENSADDDKSSRQALVNHSHCSLMIITTAIIYMFFVCLFSCNFFLFHFIECVWFKSFEKQHTTEQSQKKWMKEKKRNMKNAIQAEKLQ